MIENEENEGFDIGKWINWILTTILIIAVIYAGYKGYIKPCNCKASYETVCNMLTQNVSSVINWSLK